MDEVTMGLRDARRLGEVEAALTGRITNREGAERTGLSLRQFKRLKARVRARGAAGLLHGNRGRASTRRLDRTIEEAVRGLLEHPHARFNDCHVRDLLGEQGHRVSAETVRQVRLKMGLPAKRRRRHVQYRARRLREGQRGALLQMDGSPHHWFGPDQPRACLVGMIDDATGDPLGLCFRPEEDLHGYVTVLADVIRTCGVPQALYGDGTGIAVRNDHYWSLEEELAGERRKTQFGQILEELGVRYIRAHSPEAKGRIERAWQTLQDRLVAELALHRIRSAEAAQDFLPRFLARFRGWFARPARERNDAFRSAPRNLDIILACRYPRTVARDNIVSIPGCLIQLPPGPGGRSWHAARVEVRELLDGRLLVLRQGKVLAERPAPTGPYALVPRSSISAARYAARESDRPTRETTVVRAKARRATRPKPPEKTHPWKKHPYLTQTRLQRKGTRGVTESPWS